MNRDNIVRVMCILIAIVTLLNIKQEWSKDFVTVDSYIVSQFVIMAFCPITFFLTFLEDDEQEER